MLEIASASHIYFLVEERPKHARPYLYQKHKIFQKTTIKKERVDAPGKAQLATDRKPGTQQICL
jgi:hypothetical protein